LNCRSIAVSDVVMTPTAAMLDDVRRFVQVPPSKGAVNSYGVDPGRFAPVTPRPLASPRRLLYSSLYGEHKNFDTLMRALLLLAEKQVDFLLVTPADPSSEDQQWAYTAKADARLAADPRLRGHIQFQTNVPISQMPQLYTNADVFVYPAVIESFGHPLVEAMAAGLPIVAADVALNRELAGDAALYFSPFDPADFAAQIQRVLDDEGLRKRLQNRARERSGLFRWQAHVNLLLDAFVGNVEQLAIESRASVS
jgi:glycosyltransferase involved in cell wall biosynthesis